MANQQYGFPLTLDHILHAVEALSLKRQIADRKHFVDDQDRRVQTGCNAEAKSYVHARAVSLDRGIDEFFEFGESDDLIQLLRDHCPTHPENDTVEVDVLPAGEIGHHACTDFDQGRHGPSYIYAPGSGSANPG